jgi:SAM-dependent methyltransferase
MDPGALAGVHPLAAAAARRADRRHRRGARRPWSTTCWPPGTATSRWSILAPAALAVARERLGPRAALVDWIEGDVTTPLFGDATVDFWHDRAVFHFLTDAAARAAYLGQVHRSVKPGGHVMVATFGLDGPERCSGLPVARYDAAGIHAVFGEAFAKVGEATELHQTPWGSPLPTTSRLAPHPR